MLQGEVLAAEAGRQGRPLIRVSETLDPAARSFSFAVGPFLKQTSVHVISAGWGIVWAAVRLWSLVEGAH